MTKPQLLFVLALLGVLLMIAPAAAAQTTPHGTFNQIGNDPCSGAATPDECMASGGNLPCRLARCPACALDDTGTKSICYYLDGNTGYCTCSGGPAGRRTDGTPYPNCGHGASCGPLH